MTGIIGTLIGIIIVLIILGVIWWAVTQLLPLIPLPEPFARIIHVLLIVILVFVVLWVILVLLGSAGVRVPGPFRLGWGVPGGAFAALSAPATGHLCELLGG